MHFNFIKHSPIFSSLQMLLFAGYFDTNEANGDGQSQGEGEGGKLNPSLSSIHQMKVGKFDTFVNLNL